MPQPLVVQKERWAEPPWVESLDTKWGNEKKNVGKRSDMNGDSRSGTKAIAALTGIAAIDIHTGGRNGGLPQRFAGQS